MTALGGSLLRGENDAYVTTAGRRPVNDQIQYRCVPILLDRDGICASQTAAAGANLLINGVRASGGTVTLDVPRAVTIFSGANLSALTFQVHGYDGFTGKPMREDIVGPNVSTVTSDKAFGTVTKVVASGAVGSAVEVGWTDKLGLPVRVRNASDFSARWNGAVDAGTLVVADDTAPTTATTNDVRGVYTVSSAADGTKVFVAFILGDWTALETYAGKAQYAAGVT